LRPALGFDEAVAEAKRAAELDPVSPIISADYGNVLFRARRFDKALAQLNRALALDSNFSMALAFGALGEKDKAFALLDKEIAQRNSRPPYFAFNPLWDDVRVIRVLLILFRRVAE